MYLANFIREPEQEWYHGLYLVAIFLFMNIFVVVSRNRYIVYGFKHSIMMRRTICDLMFEKVSNLSHDSIAKTNVGKLISLISNDLFAIERTLQFAPMLFVLPVANILCYLLIGFYFDWISSLIVFAAYIFCFTI